MTTKYLLRGFTARDKNTNILHTIIFLKTLLKGKSLQSGQRERGKFDFDHHFAFLTNFLKSYNFLLIGSSRRSFS